MRLSPAQIRTLIDASNGHVSIRYDATKRSYARHDDGGYSYNTMRACCTQQTRVLKALGYLAEGPLVTEFGLKSRRWIVTPAGHDRAKELRNR